MKDVSNFITIEREEITTINYKTPRTYMETLFEKSCSYKYYMIVWESANCVETKLLRILYTYGDYIICLIQIFIKIWLPRVINIVMEFTTRLTTKWQTKVHNHMSKFMFQYKPLLWMYLWTQSLQTGKLELHVYGTKGFVLSCSWRYN